MINVYTRLKMGNDIDNLYIMPIDRKMSERVGIAHIYS